MYENFYGFSEGPFGGGPDPIFFYLAPSHSEAFFSMLSGIGERNGITVITGDPGIGKTALIHAVLLKLDKKARTAFIVFTLLSFENLLKSILHQLGTTTKGSDSTALLEEFYLYLSDRSRDENVTIIIDEAQGLDLHALQDLITLLAEPNLPNLRIQTLLIGQPELGTKLESPELKSLCEKIVVRRHIKPLTRQASSLYIDHRLKIAGSSCSEMFTPEAVDLICDHAGGIPRMINLICDGSLRIGHAKSRRKIDAEIVRDAIEDLSLFKSDEAKKMAAKLLTEQPRRERSVPRAAPARTGRWRDAYRVAAALLSIGIVLGFLLLIMERPVSNEAKISRVDPVMPEKAPALATAPERDQGLAPVQERGPAGVQAQALVQVPSASVKRKRPQRLTRRQGETLQHLTRDAQEAPTQLASHGQDAPTQLAQEFEDAPTQHDPNREQAPRPLIPARRNAAESDTLLIKQDAAWQLLQR